MNQGRADFAIVGSTPLSRLVAGLLASSHGKTVVFCTDEMAKHRLPRGIDLSVAPITRPESWNLLKTGVPETLKLLRHIGGRRSWSRIDPVLFAEGDEAKEALAHIYQMVLAVRMNAELVHADKLGPRRDGVVLADSVLLHRHMLEPTLDAWLDRLGVRRLRPDETLTMAADGSAEISGGAPIEVDQTVLADDAAMLAHIPEKQWPKLLQARPFNTITTEVTRQMAAPVMLEIDTGVILSQNRGHDISAFGAGSPDSFAARLGVFLGDGRDFRQAGQSHFEAVMTADAAPAVGRLGGFGADVLAGLGPSGAFLAPAIARWLSGVGKPDENAWFGARLVNRKTAPSLVADYGADR